MYTVRVEEWFSAAHFLTRYHGKCERLHGHNYLVRVTVTGPELDEGGMLVDFGILRQGLRDVIEKLDHRNLNDLPAFSDGAPSAERIARYVHEQMQVGLPTVRITLVEVFETHRSRATYSPD